jgi:phosphoserine aminotransferase
MTTSEAVPAKPAARPVRPEFSSGPCAKRPGWSPENLNTALLGRSHRSKPGKARLQDAIERTSALLELPPDYRLGIVPGSDTGAMEMALWSLLGPRPVQLLSYESFGKEWVTDVVKQLRLLDVEVLDAPYGALPDLSRVQRDTDLVFPWNGTTSGVRVPDAEFIGADREGLTLCDATSALFAQAVDWAKLDVATFSWQKALGGEAAHGMIVLSPRAVQRLESYAPPWPMPKLFRLTKGGKLNDEIFGGATINTPSMLCVEDWLDALTWAEAIGGLAELQRRSNANLAVLERWVARTPWADFLAENPEIRSNTSVCLKIVDRRISGASADMQAAFAKRFASLLEKEGVALDIGGYRDAPPGLRIWCGATVDEHDLETLTPWLDWGFASLAAELEAA